MELSVFYEHIVEAAEQTGKSIPEICKMVYDFGIHGVEIDYSRLKDKEEEITKLLKNAGLYINSIYAFFDFGYLSDVEPGYELLNTANRVGSNRVLVIPGFIKEGDDSTLPLENMKQALIKICKEAKTKEITVGMEDFDDKVAPFATIGQLLWFMNNVPNLTCTFDTGNFMYSEEDALEALGNLRNYIGHVHCKDRSLEEKDGEEPKLTIKERKLYSSPVGYGCIPMKEIITKLLLDGYNGPFAIEHFGSMNQLEDMKKSAVWLYDLEKQVKVVEDNE